MSKKNLFLLFSVTVLFVVGCSDKPKDLTLEEYQKIFEDYKNNESFIAKQDELCKSQMPEPQSTCKRFFLAQYQHQTMLSEKAFGEMTQGTLILNMPQKEVE